MYDYQGVGIVRERAGHSGSAQASLPDILSLYDNLYARKINPPNVVRSKIAQCWRSQKI